MNISKIITVALGLAASLTSYGFNELIVADSKPNVSKDITLISKKSMTLKNGIILTKYQEYYKDIPVLGYQVVSKKNKGDQIITWDGRLLNNIHHDIKRSKPALKKWDVINLLKNHNNIHTEKVNLPSASLFLYKQRDTLSLVYLTSFVMYGNSPTKPTAFIDANSGQIIKYWEGLNTEFKAIGPGGNEKIGRYIYGEDLSKLFINEECQFYNEGLVKTVNLAHETSPNGGSIMKLSSCSPPFENTYKEINGGFSPVNDAHAFGHVLYNLFKDWYETAPLDTALTLRVHYGRNYENAFWDGRAMTFGDGANRFYPLVSLDVTAHEVTHGFTQQNSGLIYSRQSGGMNESFSDISGEAAKFYFNAEKENSNDWIVGGDILKGPKGTGLRYFEVPEKDGRSIGHASKYQDGMDVHYSSGVYNRAFYILSNTATWDVHKAFDVFVLANQIYWSPNEKFESGACKLKKSALILGFSTDAVVSAFDKVGIDASCDIELQEAEEIGNLNGAKNSKTNFVINVPSHVKVMNIEASSVKGDVDVYARYQLHPTLEDFDCRGFNDANKSELCHIVLPKPGRYRIMLHGYTNYEDAKIKVRFY